MISRAIGFCLLPVDNRTCFIVVTPWDLFVPKEIMITTNRFNRISVSFPIERNSGMDRCDFANPTISVAVDRVSGRDPSLDHRDMRVRRPLLNSFQQRMQ
jgi:hypothetical protein